MGRLLVERVRAAPDLELAGGIARHAASADETAAHGGARIESPQTAGPLISSADALIDFSSSDALRDVLEQHSGTLEGKALVVGTTGLDPGIETMLEGVAGHAGVLVAANFSAGINLLLGLVEIAARALDAAEYDLEIIETHHGKKTDAPSGTALALARAAARARGQELDAVRKDGRSGRAGDRPTGEVGLHAVRGGSVTGEHEVLFLGERERIVLAHAAFDRAVFADGAIQAARWLIGRPPGRYTMQQVLGVESKSRG